LSSVFEALALKMVENRCISPIVHAPAPGSFIPCSIRRTGDLWRRPGCQDVEDERRAVGGVRWLLAAALAVLGLAACASPDRAEPPGVAPTTTTAGPDGVRDRT
jgi:hypothetical protein